MPSSVFSTSSDDDIISRSSKSLVAFRRKRGLLGVERNFVASHFRIVRMIFDHVSDIPHRRIGLRAISFQSRY